MSDDVGTKKKRGKHVIVDEGRPKEIRNSLRYDDGLLVVGGTVPSEIYPLVKLFWIPDTLDYDIPSPQPKQTSKVEVKAKSENNNNDLKTTQNDEDDEDENSISCLATLEDEYFGVVYLDKTLNLLVSQKKNGKATSEDIAVLDLETCKEISILKHHTDKIRDLFVHGPSNLLASTSDDGTISLWDLRDSKSSIINIILHKTQKNAGIKITSPSVKSSRPTGHMDMLVSLSSQPYPQPSVVQAWDLRKGNKLEGGKGQERYQKFISRGCTMSCDSERLLVGALPGFVMAYQLDTGADIGGRYFDLHGLYCIDHDEEYLVAGFANPGAGGLGNSLLSIDVSSGTTEANGCNAM
eukprot:TRINITY_DN4170_c0_g1_i2.p1 TRINITY_DN4170_c0_g1~~TRINITY_DN4170_c0_g1_i2.p1  ORF type:complete len:352 (-),score=54.55 TRINITY_DN4170_c0_g1_i2:61-1116(-)